MIEKALYAWFALGCLIPFGCLEAEHASEPVSDVHIHYKWSQEEVTSPEDARRILDENEVSLAVVIGTPPEFALRLAEIDPERVIPIYGPYNGVRNWFRWTHDRSLISDARKALSSGKYQGIGELHLIGGITRKQGEDSVIDGLMKLGREYDVPLLIHTEFSRETPLTELCAAHPETRILWAHAGAILKPDQVRKALRKCPNVWVELSARDPWRYVNNPIADEQTGRLLPEWEKLVLEYSDRFMIGSDPVWPVQQLDSWDEPDTGWAELGKFLNFHRKWLSFLPEDHRSRILRTNAYRLFKKTGPSPMN